MRITIEVNTDNAAFGSESTTRHGTVASMLAEVAHRWELSGFVKDTQLRDTNGNTVGDIIVELDEGELK